MWNWYIIFYILRCLVSWFSSLPQRKDLGGWWEKEVRGKEMFSSELNQMVNHLKSQKTKQQLRAFEEKNPSPPGAQAYFPRVSCLHLCTSEV